jgi:hypothetical protein
MEGRVFLAGAGLTQQADVEEPKKKSHTNTRLPQPFIFIRDSCNSTATLSWEQVVSMSLRFASMRLVPPASVLPHLERSAANVVRSNTLRTARLASTARPISLRLPNSTPAQLGLRLLSTSRPTLLETSLRRSSQSGKSTKEQAEQAEEADSDAPPPKASLRERLKFLTRRYGWWALGVYLAASSVDFSLTFLAIHLLGADHIRSLEAQVRSSLGLEQRHDDPDSQDGKKQSGSSTIWTEAVLAYTIHKTLLLPVRVAFTAAVTPSFVKWLVKMGWARANHQVKAQVGRKAADKAIQDVIKRNAAKETTKHS